MKAYLVLALLLSILTAPLAQAHRPVGTEAPDPAKPPYDSARVWLGPPAAFLVGFGLGHAVQDRFPGYPVVYPIADGLGWLLIIGTMGDRADGKRGSRDKIHDLGFGLIVASRIAQVIDTLIWSVDYYQTSRPSVAMRPNNGGMEMVATIPF